MKSADERPSLGDLRACLLSSVDHADDFAMLDLPPNLVLSSSCSPRDEQSNRIKGGHHDILE